MLDENENVYEKEKFTTLSEESKNSDKENSNIESNKSKSQGSPGKI